MVYLYSIYLITNLDWSMYTISRLGRSCIGTILIHVLFVELI
jgi:hypothetical protein